MKPLYTEFEYLKSKGTDKLPCECYYCNNKFYVMKKNITQELKYNRGRIKFCTFSCSRKYLKKRIIVICKQCNKEFEKSINQINKTKNNFCSCSCNVLYNNTHKTKGNRRSKLELYLEKQLKLLYPELEILYNNKDIINSELDIFIPSLKLAFELNGLFHYEPIFGDDTLNKIQNNDQRKFQACLEHRIELCIIDTSQQKYVKESTSKKYLDIIINIINLKLLNF